MSAVRRDWDADLPPMSPYVPGPPLPSRAAALSGVPSAPSALTVIGLETIKPRSIEWLWPARIPLGKVTIVDGDPGLGKSTVMIDIACRGSRGQPTPTGESMGDPFVSLIVSSEDAADETIVPRINRAGGDPTMIKLITDLTIPDEIDLLEQAIGTTGRDSS